MQISQIVEVSAIVIGVGSLGVSGILWNIIKAYQARVVQLEDETKACSESHIDNLNRIKELEGKVIAFKEIPLKEIAETQKNILHTQKDILKFIKEIKG